MKRCANKLSLSSCVLVILGWLKQVVRGVQGMVWSWWDGYMELEVSDRVIGESVEGRQIELFSFGEGAKTLLYVGGMHGNEVGTIKLMQQWVKYLQVCDISARDVRVLVVPCLNPDAWVIARARPDWFGGGRYVKYNGNRVDINRNFPTSNRSAVATMFLKGESHVVSGGSCPGSEPETQALLSLIQKEGIDTVYVFHNRRGTVMSSFSAEADARTERYAARSGYKIFGKSEWEQWGEGHNMGHFTLWGQENNVSVIEIEMQTRWLSEWGRNKEALVDSLG